MLEFGEINLLMNFIITASKEAVIIFIENIYFNIISLTIKRYSIFPMQKVSFAVCLVEMEKTNICHMEQNQIVLQENGKELF